MSGWVPKIGRAVDSKIDPFPYILKKIVDGHNEKVENR